jgi:hypothetical protein
LRKRNTNLVKITPNVKPASVARRIDHPFMWVPELDACRGNRRRKRSLELARILDL